MRIVPCKVLGLLCLAASAFLLTGCGAIAGGYRIPDSATKTRNYSSISGDVDVGRGASIQSVKTVAGGIDVAAGSRVKNLASVAGNIHVAAEVEVAGSIKTVAGDIDIDRGCTVDGDVGTIAGRIAIADSLVKGDVNLRGGALDLTRTKVTGAIRVRSPKGDDRDGADITIGRESDVAEIIVDKDAHAHLRIHRSAKVGSVKGIEAEYFD